MKTIKNFFLFAATVMLFIVPELNAQFVSMANSGANGVGHSVFFVNADTGFVAGEDVGKGVIQRTTDGGSTWTRVYTSAANSEWVNDIFFVNEVVGFAVGVSGSILATADGGSTWNRQTVSNVNEFKSVYFPNASVGYAVGDGSPLGPIYKTTDGGFSWAAQTSAATGALSDVFFTSPLIGYVSGDNEVLATTDGGTTWSNLPMSSNTSLFCSNANVCYMGGAGSIKKTSDGGVTWNNMTLPVLSGANVYIVMALHFTDLQTGFAAGAIYDTASSSVVNGVILKTTNAGLTWNNINTAANNTTLQNKPLSSVHFFDTQNGYLTGASGVVLATTNAGMLPCNVALSVTATNSSCGQPTGTAAVVSSGGNTPYTYQWTNGDKALMADSLSSGLYMVTVTDASGCTQTAPAMIIDAGSPTIMVTSTTSVSCNGGNNGAINISVSGGISPYTYHWVNGATTQDISNLVAGPYQVYVNGADGCMAMENITVFEPAVLTASVNITNAACGNPNGSATVYPSGGTSPYSYAWSTVPAQTALTATGLSALGYSVTVTDAKGCSHIAMVPVINVGGAVIAQDSVAAASCATNIGSMFITVTGGAPPYTYAWSNGSTAQDLVNVPPGPYSLLVTGVNSCNGAFMGVVPAAVPATPLICIVDVDSATGKNVCLFVKDSIANPGISHYNFYRESIVAGQYQLLGSKSASQLSLWADQSANPLQHSWRYKVSAVDTCGNESPVSSYHKTIHLAANVGINNQVNLAWDDYEGFPFTTFVIYRSTAAAGWDSLDAVSANVHSYSDLNPPTPLVDVYYYVSVRNLASCVATVKNPEVMASNLNFSKSNVNRINPTTGVHQYDDLHFSVSAFPNPASGKIRIQSSALKSGTVDLFDVMGQKILTHNLVQGILDLDLSSEPNGIYFLKISGKEGAVTKKIVLHK